MDTQPPLPGESGSNLSKLADASEHTGILRTQQERRHQVVYRDTTNAAIEHVTQDAHLNPVRKAGISNKKKQHTIGCEYVHFEVNGCQFTV